MEPKVGLISDATAENPGEARASSRSKPETKRGKTSMSKKIMILSTSPRKGGNSDGLADAFAEGAREAGHQVEKIVLYDKTIGFCRGCLACQKTQRCVIRDDADAIAQTMRSAEVIVFATPIYFYEMCGQMKTLLDRTNPSSPRTTPSGIFICWPVRRTGRKAPWTARSRACRAGSTVLKRPA